MMSQSVRMSPLTAFFIGLFFCGAVAIASGAAVVLYGLRVAETQASRILGLAGDTLGNLPEVIEALPPALTELLNDRRAPEYAANIDVSAVFRRDAKTQRLHPVITVKNHGDKVVSLLTVRVVALDSNGVALRDWTQVVATPIGVDHDWPGPLLPNMPRHMVVNGGCGHYGATVEGMGEAVDFKAAIEIADVRVWLGAEKEVRTASAPSIP